jgi:hypothetical protein
MNLDTNHSFFTFLLKKAQIKRLNAGYSGDGGDGGAREIENSIKIYKAGMEGTLPDVWIGYWKEFQMENDPEYAKYLELKKKFEK